MTAYSKSAWYPIAAETDLPFRHVFHAMLLGREFAVSRRSADAPKSLFPRTDRRKRASETQKRKSRLAEKSGHLPLDARLSTFNRRRTSAPSAAAPVRATHPRCRCGRRTPFHGLHHLGSAQ